MEIAKEKMWTTEVCFAYLTWLYGLFVRMLISILLTQQKYSLSEKHCISNVDILYQELVVEFDKMLPKKIFVLIQHKRQNSLFSV